jgi:hypothetical protein
MLRIPHCLDNRLTVNCEILATCSSTYSHIVDVKVKLYSLILAFDGDECTKSTLRLLYLRIPVDSGLSGSGGR